MQIFDLVFNYSYNSFMRETEAISIYQGSEDHNLLKEYRQIKRGAYELSHRAESVERFLSPRVVHKKFADSDKIQEIPWGGHPHHLMIGKLQLNTRVIYPFIGYLSLLVKRLIFQED